MKIIGIMVITYLLASCAHGIKEYQNSPVTQGFIGECYSLTSESYVYEARCVDLENTGFGGRVFCPGIQSFKAGGNWEKSPKSYGEYLEQKTYWDGEMFDKLLFENQRTISYPVSAGTKLHVKKVVLYPWGGSGHKWAIRAILYPEGKDPLEVELPTIRLLTHGEIWIESEFMGFPSLKSKYAEKCDV